ncbi:permease-like cell division protein FtsX [Anaerostipes sp.]|uniref:permease-like cell division protein FtsX n=1 Tax=Anaerostipes sp. TaxID=1872530 RepID=UPI0025BC75EF|nr:permease-like cell division protein FtsX [Anaerostipes sp.]MBS7009354.1 permease-like cell division protein FtsX [Anaerostipes sp.]
MIFRRLAYGFKEGLKNIFRNKIFSLATVGTIMACIFLLGVTLSVLLNVRATVKQAEDSVTISVFFDEKLPKDQKDAIGKRIRDQKEVQSVRYVSAEEAWAKYKKEVFKNNEDLLEGFEGKNPLNESDSYEVMLKDVKFHEKMVTQFQSLDGVRKVEYAKGAAEGISKANLLGAYVAGAIILILLFVSVFLVSNTVSIGIAVRGEEIAIMRLIGATNRFIRAPFIVEGAVIGVIGSLIPVGAIYIGYKVIVNYIMDKFHVLTNFMEFVPVHQIMVYLIPASLLVGLGIGCLGSSFTIRKYLRV